MKKIFIYFILALCFCPLNAQQYLLKGKVIDTKTGKLLGNVLVKDNVTNKRTLTDSFGSFQLKVDSIAKLEISRLNYITYTKKIRLKRNKTLTFYIEPKDIDIDAVQINGIKTNLTSNVISLTEKKMQSIPALAGENDIIKALQLTPGVQNSGENSVGLNVRGGDNSQNLILFDNVNFFNPSHLFGFVSAFNSDEIQKINFYKGGFPAQYGGKISSIVDIKLKNGSMDSLNGNFSIGLISAKLFINGPLAKKTTFILSARTTYLNGLIKLKDLFFKSKYEHLKNIGFYETNFKITHYFPSNFSVSFGSYIGADSYKYGINKKDSLISEFSTESIAWSNLLNYISFHKSFRKNIHLDLLLANVKYSSKILSMTDEQDFKENEKYYNTDIIYSSISDKMIKLNCKIYKNYFNFNFGLQYFYHTFSPALKRFYDKKTYEAFDFSTIKKINSFNIDFYTNMNVNISKSILLNLGIRMPFYFTGDYVFKNNLEPRLALVYKFNSNNLLRVSFSKMSQYSFLLSNNSFGMPSDVWVPATKYTNFQTAHQYSIAFNTKIFNNINFNIDLYYKNMQNLIDFKNVVSYPDYSNYENLIETGGIGKAYGIEIFMQKNIGRFNAWISYTYSRTLRKFENINNNNWYPFKYDRPHNFSITGSYKYNHSVDIGFTWVFASGHAITMPVAVFPQTNRLFDNKFYYLYYGGRNSSRMPCYHRLDLGIKFHKIKNNKIHILSFDIYNAYNHLNAYYILLLRGSVKHPGYDYSVWKRTLFPIIPSVSYSLKF